MATTEKLRYFIEAVWKGGSATAKASADISEVGDAAEQAGSRTVPSLRGIATGMAAVGVAAGGMYVAAREVWNLLGEGADLAVAEYQFGRLAESIDSTADVMLGRLREATAGMVSDADLVQSATDIMSLGLQDTEDGVVRLATVTGKLGWDMQQVILTMANNSTMRLDSLGLSIDDVQTKMKALEEQGFDADKAFDLAVIEAGEEKLLLVGDAADTDAGKLAQLETVLQNVQNQFKEEFSSSIISQFGEIESAAGQTEARLGSLATTVAGLSGSIVGGVANWLGQIDLTQRYPMTPADYARLAGAYQVASRDANLGASRAAEPGGTQFGYTTADLSYNPLVKSTSAVLKNKEAWDLANESTRAGIEYQRELADGIEKATGGFGGYSSAIASASDEMRALASASGDFFSQARGMKDFNLAEEFFKMADAAGASAAELADLGLASGLFDEAEAGDLLNKSYILQAGKQIAAGIGEGMTADQAWSEIMGLESGLDESGALAREFFEGLDEATAEPAMQLNTDPALALYDSWKISVESNPPVIKPILEMPGEGQESQRSDIREQQHDKLTQSETEAGLS